MMSIPTGNAASGLWIFFSDVSSFKVIPAVPGVAALVVAVALLALAPKLNLYVALKRRHRVCFPCFAGLGQLRGKAGRRVCARVRAEGARGQVPGGVRHGDHRHAALLHPGRGDR